MSIIEKVPNGGGGGGGVEKTPEQLAEEAKKWQMRLMGVQNQMAADKNAFDFTMEALRSRIKDGEKVTTR